MQPVFGMSIRSNQGMDFGLQPRQGRYIDTDEEEPEGAEVARDEPMMEDSDEEEMFEREGENEDTDNRQFAYDNPYSDDMDEQFQRNEEEDDDI